MTANTILITYQFTGGLYTGPQECHYNVIITISIDILFILLMGM